VTENEIWTKWESQVVNGLFPLRRFLAKSDHSVVFLTDCKARNLSKAAIKIVPADPAEAELQLAHFSRFATLSHPHLVRILDTGRCNLGGHPFLFIVMEYAEQTLAQILHHRPLTLEEVQEMLVPTLSALGFLHRKNLVQSQLKPSNFLVVNDQLKLASDTVRPVGESSTSFAKASLYDAPEAKKGPLNAASDVWGLGISVVEALTQRPPRAGDEFDIATLPADLPLEFVDAIGRCLDPDPGRRPTIPQLEAQFKPAPPTNAASTSPPADIASPPPADIASPPPANLASPPPVNIASPPAANIAIPPSATLESRPRTLRERPHKARMLVPAIAVSAIVLVAIWAGMHRSQNHPNVAPPASRSEQTTLPPASSPLAASPNQATPTSAASVLHQEIPVVSRSARESIHGEIKVAVLVTVDHSGKVISETLQTHGSSKYFTRLATEAAKDWRFAPTDSQASRQWLLRFEFSRSGAAGQALPHGP
jgi:serine/threonine protein kinase